MIQIRQVLGKELLAKPDVAAALAKVEHEAKNWSIEDETKLHNFPSQKQKLLKKQITKPHAHLHNLCKKSDLAGCKLCKSWMHLLATLKDHPKEKARLTDELSETFAKRMMFPLAVSALALSTAGAAGAYAAGVRSPTDVAELAHKYGRKIYDEGHKVVAAAQHSKDDMLRKLGLGHKEEPVPAKTFKDDVLRKLGVGRKEEPSPASPSSPSKWTSLFGGRGSPPSSPASSSSSDSQGWKSWLPNKMSPRM